MAVKYISKELLYKLYCDIGSFCKFNPKKKLNMLLPSDAKLGSWYTKNLNSIRSLSKPDPVKAILKIILLHYFIEYDVIVIEISSDYKIRLVRGINSQDLSDLLSDLLEVKLNYDNLQLELNYAVYNLVKKSFIPKPFSIDELESYCSNLTWDKSEVSKTTHSGLNLFNMTVSNSEYSPNIKLDIFGYIRGFSEKDRMLTLTHFKVINK